jgi:SAM-dependent methyltransferase
MSDMAQAYLAQAMAGDRDHWSGPPEMVDRIAEMMGARRDHTVVDVGAGVGGPARRLSRLTGCRVVAVDVLPRIIGHAKRRSAVDRESERVDFVGGSAVAMPLRSESADQVWSLGMVAHVVDHERFAREVFRVLRRRGKVVLTEAFWNGDRLPRFVRSAPGPWRPLRPADVMSAMAAGGLADIVIRPWPGNGIAGALETADPSLRKDLGERRLVPLMITASRS